MNVKEKEDMSDYKETLWEKISFNVRYTFPFEQLLDLKYYLKNLIFRRHHIIKTGLKKGQWYDTDTRMLYGMMNMLVSYIEDEKPFEIIEWDEDDTHRNVKEEILAIKEWWDNYHNREAEIGIALHDWHEEKFSGCEGDEWLKRINSKDTDEQKRLFDRHEELKKKLFEEEQDMLIRLVKIRRFLWT